MGLTLTVSDIAKQAAANRMAGGTSLLQAKYVLFVDGVLLGVPVRFCADATTVTPDVTASPPEVNLVATGTCPAGVTTPIGGATTPTDGSTQYTLALIIGDVGTYSIASITDAIALAAGTWVALENYLIATVTGTGAGGDVIAVVAGDSVKCTEAQITT